jgi:hypothetical protein
LVLDFIGLVNEGVFGKSLDKALFEESLNLYFTWASMGFPAVNSVAAGVQCFVFATCTS